jgi:RNA polymerase sigma-70 factor (ECF subfamily)
VLRYVGDPAAAEDVTQEAFLKAWKNLKKFDAEKNFKTWIFSIARNSSIDFLRKKQTLNFSAFEGEDQNNPLVDNLADPEPLPLDLLKTKEFMAEFELALQNLPEGSRVVLLMHLSDDLTFKEIAKILKQPLDTVKSRYRRGLIVLRKVLEYKRVNQLH